MKVEGCYAKILDSCSGKLSREHVVSKSLLGDQISIKGVHQTLSNKTIGKNSFTIKHLCEGHNNYLSSSDKEMNLFLKMLVDINELEKKPILTRTKIYTVNGILLERWFFKTFLNEYLSGMNSLGYRLNIQDYLDYLFNEKRFEENYGFYYVNTGKTENNIGGYEFFPVFDENKNIILCLINMQGHKVLLVLPVKNNPFIADKKLEINNETIIINYNAVWHPSELEIPMKIEVGGERILLAKINFNWE